MKFSVANHTGGQTKEFSWQDQTGLSVRALRHAAEIGPPSHCVFSGPAGQRAAEEYADIYEQYLGGNCSAIVEEILSR